MLLSVAAMGERHPRDPDHLALSRGAWRAGAFRRSGRDRRFGGPRTPLRKHEIARSPLAIARKPGGWTQWSFVTDKHTVYVGNAWTRPHTQVYWKRRRRDRDRLNERQR